MESLARDDCYRVDALMSESAHDQTQRVYFLGANGAEVGPYVRKLIRRESGLGNAYRRIYDAQRSGRRFKHIPHVLECHEAGEDLVAVMELVRGESLAALIERMGPSADLACAVFPPLCDAVAELHGEFDPPIIHRDLKPSNVIVSWPSAAGEGGGGGSRCDVTLIDFDISRVKRDGPGADTVRFGTPAFAPPEQFGFAQTTERSDVHALGALLFFCLTGEAPDQEVRQRNWVDSRVPEPMRCVIARAAAFDPDDRYASAAELKQAFHAAEGQIARSVASSMRVSERAEAMARVEADSTQTGGAPSEKAPEDASRKDARGKAPLAIVVGGIACVAVAAVVAFGVLGQGATSTASPAASGQSVSAQASVEGDSDSVLSSDAASLEPLSQDEAAEGLQTPGVPKDGFDPATNFTVSTAGLEFEVPSYFKMETGADDNGSSLYYAETGSSVAMILVRENPIDLPATRDDFEKAKDDYVSSMIEAGGDILGEIVSSTDYELAGRAARVVTTSGKTTNGLVVTAKEVFFFEEDRNVVGAIMFGQTNNVQFDYSQDFAKVITSARDAGTQ